MKTNRGYDEVMIVNPYDPRSSNQQIKLMRFHQSPKGVTTREPLIWLLRRAARVWLLRRGPGIWLLRRGSRIRLLRRAAGYGYYAEPEYGYYATVGNIRCGEQPYGYYGEPPEYG